MQKGKNNTNIQDFGEKIGGARKDLATTRSNTKPGKEVIHDYTVSNTDNGYSVNFKGKILKDGFKTQNEAKEYILDFKENIKSNLAFVKEYNNSDTERYLIYIRNPRTLKSQYAGKEFANKQDAEEYAMALSIYLKEYGKNLYRPEIQSVERINPNNENVTKATGENILNDFGFKGGEFGNWVKQSERQDFLNYAYDAFTDLATALEINESSLGQNDSMNIAFGARGSGLTGAVAHFEPGKKVINMTRLKGAGSLAHEYGHSIDNYLSRVGGYSEEGMATTNSQNPKLSENMKKAIKQLIDAMKYNVSTNQAEIDKKNSIYEKNRLESLNYHLKYLDKVFNGEATKYKYNRKIKQYEQVKVSATIEQQKEYKQIKKILEDGKLNGEISYKTNSYGFKESDKIYPEAIEKLKTLYKDVMGRKIDEDTIYWLYRHGKPAQQVKEVKSESAYSKSALELDRATGRSTAYFSKTEEMWARAFEAYVSDKLKAKGITNTYLVHSVNNSDYALFNPFPAGEERVNINKAFDNLIQVMKDERLYEPRSRNKQEINTNPTDNPDIRYLKKTSKQNIPVDENIQKELHNRIQNAILSKNSRKNTFLGRVSQRVVDKVRQLYGIDITGREHIISDYDIRHIIKQHGNPELEKTKGQIAITAKDIEKIPEIIANYDSIVIGNDNKQGKTIRYIKKYDDNKIYVVEVIPNANDKSLYIKTMWKKPVTLTNNQKTPSSTSKTRGNSASSTLQNSVSVSHDNNNIVLPYTSKTKPNSSSLDNSIAQNPKNVNNNKKVKTNIIDDLMNDIIQKSKNNFKSDIKINSDIVDREALLPLNYNKLKQSTLYNLAKKLFSNIHRRTFKNNNENIHVTNSDIDESIAQTLRNPNQKALLKENIAVFSQLDKIIESGMEIQSSNQPISDNKMRQQYSDYKYYYSNVYIDGEPSIVQFDTRVQKGTTGKDERHFRLERIYKINEVDSNGGTDKSIIHFSNESTSTTSIPQNPENVNNSKKTSDIEAGQRNAERTDAYIEQEIKKIEATGEWDDSIPVTKMTDIRKSIEDYLGIGVQKGHFRQQAYAIYNTKNGSIRTKEFKDMDSILHEVGHAIDLGNKISVDKESIAKELLAAINKYGGYEGNPRSVLLDEGFAEVIREYAIIPEQAKSEYPQAVAVLEGIRANDKSFDKFISNIQKQIYNYIHQSPQNRVMSNLSIGEQTDKVPLTKKTLKEKIVKLVWDKDYALKSAVNELSNGKKLDPSQNAYILARLASGVNDKAISIITNGYISLDGTKTFQGLGKLGDILGNNEQRFNDLRAYLVAQRDLEYKAKTLKTGIRTIDSQAVVDKFKNDTQIQRAAKIVYDTLDGVLQYAVDNGLITRADADILRQDNAFYVPFQRVIENNGNQVGKRGEVKDIIKRRTGSELDVKDVLENIVVNSTNIIKQVENNNILRALYKEGENAGIMNNIFEKIPAPMKKIGTENLSIWEKELKKQGIDTDNIDLEKTIDIFVPDNKTDVGNRITSFIDENGKRVYLQFSKDATDIFNTVMNLDSKTMSMVLKINSKLNMPLRFGATIANVGFAIPNMISDTAQAAIYSEAGFIPVVDNALGVLDILTATNKSVAKFMDKVAPEYANRINRLYTVYEQSGATSSTRMSQYRKSTQEIMRDVYGTKNSEVLGIKESFKPLKRLLDLMTYIPEISEQSTRFRVFEKNYSNTKTKGGTELDARIKAAIESKDATQDFGRTGTFTREINQLIPFSAARVGSAYTFAEKIKANPKATSMRIAILTAIALAIKAIGYNDKEIEELNQRKKDDNFVLKIGDNVITIKKPQGILRSIINLAEYIQDLVTGHIEEGKEGERLGEWLNNAIMDNMPADSITGLVPNAVAPLIENAINKDFYYNTEIVKSYDLDLPDEEQYYDYNSQLAILLGKIFNYSPAKIDNLISGYFGGLGTQVTNVIDWMSGKLGLSAEEPNMGAEENAIGKRFVVNVNTNSASIDEVYSRRDELTKKLNGGTITADEEEELERLKDAISTLSKINKQIKAIKQDLTLSADEKAEQIRKLQQQRTDTARQALGKDLIYPENETKIESTKFYPSSSSLSYNGYTLELTEDMKKEYENLAYEKYKQYKQQGLYSDEYLEKLESTCKDYAKKTLIQKYKKQLVKSK